MRVEIEVREEEREVGGQVKRWWKSTKMYRAHVIYLKIELTNEERAIIEHRNLGDIPVYSEKISLGSVSDVLAAYEHDHPGTVDYTITVNELLENYQISCGDATFARIWLDKLENKVLPAFKALLSYTAEPIMHTKRAFEL